MKKPKHVYVVTMYRFGNRESHSYVLGAYSSHDIAEQHAKVEKEWRAGKYSGEVLKLTVDSEVIL